VYAGTVTISQYPLYVPADGGPGTIGSPFAVYVTYTGGAPSANCYIKAYAYGTNYGAADGYAWNPSSSSWVNQASTWSNQRGITLDGSGNWSGWIHVKIPPATTYGADNFRVRIREASTNYDATVTVTYVHMSTGCTANCGGWVEETVGTARAGRAVSVENNTGSTYGLYIVENNGVTEGYSSSAGYYKVAVPTCTNCNYHLETWDLSAPGTPVGRQNDMPDDNGNNTVTAGTTTLLTFSSPTAVTLRTLSSGPWPLSSKSWSGLLVVGWLLLVVAAAGVVIALRRHA
jgi:hypothetical protein